MVRLLSTCLILTVLAAGTDSATATEFFGPTPYTDFADSPFAANGSFQYFFVEDFEDGLLNAPGLIANGGIVIGDLGLASPYVDSIDSDDGVIDGSGSNGHSLWTGKIDGEPPLGRNEFVFAFEENVLGSLPTHAGVVWTDVIDTANGSFSDLVSFEAFDAEGSSLGVIGPVLVGGDGSRMGLTGEDRFFGAYHSAGISVIHIQSSNSPNWEIDHVQYGFFRIPEPSALLLIAIGFSTAYTRSIARQAI